MVASGQEGGAHDLIDDMHQSGEMSFHPLVYWYLTFRCNLSCKHCWVESSPTVDMRQDLNTSECIDLVNKLKEVKPSMITFSGGEPLIRDDFVAIAQSVINAGINLTIETNGTVRPLYLVKICHFAQEAGVRCWVSISLDGGSPSTHESLRGRGTFNKTVRTIKLLVREGVEVGVQYLLTPTNLLSIPHFFNLMSDIKPTMLAFSVVYLTGRATAHTSELVLSSQQWTTACHLIREGLRLFRGQVMVKVPPAKIPPQHLKYLMSNTRVTFLTSCSFPAIGILPDGTLSICALTGRKNSLILGHYSTCEFPRILEQDLTPLRRAYENLRVEGVCKTCIFLPSCRGGCRASAYMQSGSFFAANPLCCELNSAGRFPMIYKATSSVE
jgi:radical SAM protein with 4Fe4S-binding SPASM domain